MTINELMMDKEFCQRAESAKTTDEIVSLFAEKGLTVAAEQATEANSNKGNGELNEEMLDAVAGGCWFCKVGGFFVYLVSRAGGSSRAEARANRDDFRAKNCMKS